MPMLTFITNVACKDESVMLSAEEGSKKGIILELVWRNQTSLCENHMHS